MACSVALAIKYDIWRKLDPAVACKDAERRRKRSRGKLSMKSIF